MKKDGYFNPVLKLKIKSRLKLILLVNQVNNLESQEIFALKIICLHSKKVE